MQRQTNEDDFLDTDEVGVVVLEHIEDIVCFEVEMEEELNIVKIDLVVHHVGEIDKVKEHVEDNKVEKDRLDSEQSFHEDIPFNFEQLGIITNKHLLVW
jgi:hypothetical protein